jgi:hypothetical protein
MPKKPTASDAQLILQLYDLRREAVMRAARKFMVSEFWPQNYDEFKAVFTGYGTDQNTHLRQVLTYWDMACAMVTTGALNEELFYQSNNEPYFLWAKFGEYLPQARKDSLTPQFGMIWEKVMGRPLGKQRVKMLGDRLAARRAAAQAAKAR